MDLEILLKPPLLLIPPLSFIILLSSGSAVAMHYCDQMKVPVCSLQYVVTDLSNCNFGHYLFDKLYVESRSKIQKLLIQTVLREWLDSLN